jgi:hypothetical protein
VVIVFIDTTSVFVNDDFAGLTMGDLIQDADPNTPGNQAALFGVSAFATIQEGVDAVDPGGPVFITDDLATDGPGTYTENVTITKDVQIIGTEGDPAAVRVDGNQAGSVFTIGATFTVTIDSVTIQNGSAVQGGGINNLGNLTLANSTVTGNSASNDGGAIFNAGTLNVDGSTIGDSIIENDVWSQSASAGDLVFVFVDTQNSTAGMNVLLDVLENDGTTVIDNNNLGISAGGTVAQGGSVFYNVQGDPFAGDPVTPYQIYASVVDPGTAIAETEGNDDAGSANPITEENLVTGTIESATDADVFSVTVADGSSLVVILDSLAGTNAILEILDTDGTSVLATGTVDAFSLDSAAIASGLPAGTYFIRVTGNAGATGGYQFVAKEVAGADQVAETESNNTPATANPLSASQFGQGSLLQVGGNTALRGGGIFNAATGTVTVTNLSVISNNTASGNGGIDGGAESITTAAW